MNSSDKKNQPYSMARLGSFVVLLVIICIATVLFYRVMQSFILPLFLATLAVVIFKPVHAWVLRKCGNRKRLASFLMTVAIGLTIFGPLAMFGFIAVDEGRQLLKSDWELNKKLAGLRDKFQMDIPAKAELDTVRDHYDAILELNEQDQRVELNVQPGDIRSLRDELTRLRAALDVEFARDLQGSSADWVRTLEPEVSPEDYQTLHKLWRQGNRSPAAPAELTERGATKLKSRVLNELDARSTLDDLVNELSEFAALDDADGVPVELRDELQDAVELSKVGYDTLRVKLLGGVPWSILRELAHPNATQIESWKRTAGNYLTKLTLSLSGRTPALLARTLLVIFIMLIAVYYFLVDGPEMIRTLMRLSPLDDQYEAELLAEFDNVSRAVVLATLLSALAQGVLAGIGYFFFGVPSVFLLTLLTGVIAMIPFVGAAAVWVPASLYLAFIADPPHTGAAIGLAIYGFIIVSMADNIIKPLVLHGQSNLHPLLALLSVLGGVSALGPVGILVGPMVVAFLQALLNILRKEMTGMSQSTA